MHPDQEALAGLALGEPAAADLRAHVDGCPTCSAELQALRDTLRVVRAPRPELVTAPASVWDRVTSAIDEPEVPAVAPPPAHPDELAARRRTPGRRRVGLGWVAGAAAAGLVFGVVGARVVGGQEEAPAPVTLASTSLETLDTLQPRGKADLLSEDGHTDLVVHTEPIKVADGYLEVWLINRDLKRMVSVGVLSPGQEDQTFTIPQELIDQGYVIVDISREGYDDKPQHSGDSVVRGTLPA